MKRAYKLRHVLIDWRWQPQCLLSDTGQWVTGEPPKGYERASAAQWRQDT